MAHVATIFPELARVNMNRMISLYAQNWKYSAYGDSATHFSFRGLCPP